MKAILTDVTRCIGCEECVEACRRVNGLGEERPYRWIRTEDRLSADRFTTIVRKDGYFIRKQCRHCLEPACASACPVGALHKTPEGPVVYDSEKCLGCRYCMMACPFGIPRYSWYSPVPYVRKCTMCYETRIRKGLQPACTEACPVQATIFGERDELLKEAHKRIAENPNKYMPKVFGETEVGGTLVLYLAPISLDVLSLGLPVGDDPLPLRTLPAMMAVPPAFIGMGVLMGGLYWLIERRNRLRSEQSDAKDDKISDTDSDQKEGKE